MSDPIKRGLEELRQVRRRSRPLYWAVGVFSLFANLLLLTGPLYMMNVYDRVLGSGSIETLVALSLLAVFLYGIMGALDASRTRVMNRVAARFQADLDRRVFNATLRKSAVLPDANTNGGLAHLSAVQQLLASPLITAAMDLPWMPLFFGAIFVFHPVLGALALAGAAALIAITITNQLLTRRAQDKAAQLGQAAEHFADHLRTEAEMVQGLGMADGMESLWASLRNDTLIQTTAASDKRSLFSALTKMLRLMLQSGMLGAGAWLVLQGEMTAGGMVAASILLGRALSPVEAILGQWPIAQRGMQGWQALALLLGQVAPPPQRTALPRPQATITATALTVMPPGEKRAALRGVSFTVEPGQAVGVIGPSGAGKSSLARVLTGLWPPTAGDIRLDGAALAQYGADLGGHVGHLPQRVHLFEGTIAQNIARFTAEHTDASVVEAAKLAAAHEIILSLPQGYDTPVTSGQSRLSGGQLQRIGLARALYGTPAVVVLDEPNANLDSEGTQALNAAIRQIKGQGTTVFIMAHRPAAIKECDQLLMLDGGMRKSFGPRDEVLSTVVKNAHRLQDTPVAAGHVI